MKFISDILVLFSTATTLKAAVVRETYSEATFVFENVTDFVLPDKNQLEAIIVQICPGDVCEVKVIIGENEANIQSSTQANANLFIDTISSELEHRDDLEQINLEFKIVKNITKEYINVYHSESFFKYLNSIDFKSILYIFKELISNSRVINFILLEDNEFTFSTPLLSISGDSPSVIADSSKITSLNSLSSLCHTSLDSFQNFIPEDFKIKEPKLELKNFSNNLEFIKNILSIAFVFDITSIDVDTDKFYSKLNGYRSFIFDSTLSTLSTLKLDHYFEIYTWVYDNKNIGDKIGLARNVISLYLKDTTGLELKQDLLTSLNSGYQIYLKDNIKQYVEIRNKISEQLIDFNKRANTLIENFASGFQKSSLAVISFYVSAIALRLLGKDDHECLFSFTPTLLALGILAGSLIYFKTSRWDIAEQRKRFISSYTNMKERYTDLLDASDINRILNNDKEFDADIKFINDKMRKYSVLWISVIIIFTIVTIVCFISCYLESLAKIIGLFSGSNCNC
jgi:hypothetical protein